MNEGAVTNNWQALDATILPRYARTVTMPTMVRRRRGLWPGRATPRLASWQAAA